MQSWADRRVASQMGSCVTATSYQPGGLHHSPAYPRAVYGHLILRGIGGLWTG